MLLLCGYWNRFRCCKHQALRHSSSVLCDGCEQELILRAARSSETQAIQLKNALEVSEEHLDLLAVLARLLVSIGLGDIASDLPCRFMDAASDLAHRCVRTAARLQRATRTIGLAGSIDDGASLGDVGTQVLERAPLLPQYLSLWAAVFVGLFVPLEVAAR